MSELKFNGWEEVIPYLEEHDLTQSYILDFFDKLRVRGLEEKFLREVFSYKPFKEKHRRNFIKALAIAQELNEKYSWAKGKWAFFGGMGVIGHLSKVIGIENAIREKGCTDIDILVDNSVLSPSELKKIYDIQIGVLYPCEKFYSYDVDLTKVENLLIYSIKVPVIGLNDLIKLKEQAARESVRYKKHKRDLSLLERYVIKK